MIQGRGAPLPEGAGDGHDLPRRVEEVEARAARLEAARAGAAIFEALPEAPAEIAAREGAEHAIERERRRLTEVLSRVPAMVGVLEGPDHRYVFANAAMKQGLGGARVVGLPWREVHPYLVPIGLLSALDKVCVTGERAEFHEFRVEADPQNTGAISEVFFDFVYEPLRDADDSVHSVLIFAVEVTDQVKARRRTEALAREYQFLTDALPQMVWRMTARGTIDYVNDKLTQYLGLPRADVIGQGWAVLDAAIHPDDLDDTMRRRSQEGLVMGQLLQVEHRLRRADGAYRWHLTRIVPMTDDRGRVLRWFGISIDIEDRKRIEERLRRGEEELRALVENLPALAWSAQPDGDVDFYNRRWYEYTGTTFEEVRGRRGTALVDPPMLPEVLARCRRSLDTGELFEMELRLRGSDGQYRWFLTRVCPLRDERGRILRWFGTNTDIDEQRRLSDEREMFQALVEASDDLIAIAAPDGRGIYLNRAGRRLLGLGEHDEICERTIAEFFDEEWLPRVMAEIVPELLAAGRWSGEAVCRNLATGERIPVYSNSIGIPGAEPGRARLLAAVARDLRPQKAAEAERASLLVALDLLAKAGSVLASSLDVETTLRNVAHLIVPDLASFCAVCLQDDSGAIQLVAVAHEDPAREALVREAFARKGCPPAPDAEHLAVLRGLGAASTITVPLAVHGRTLGAMTLASSAPNRYATATDAGLAEELARRVAVALDNARLFEAAQIERRRAEEANQAKDDFLATVSHELRAPLNAMLGWTRLLRGGDLDPEREARALDTIERNAHAQAQLIEDLLDISRIIAGHLRLDVRLVNLVQVVEAAIEAVRPAAEAKGVSLRTQLDPSGVSILGDPSRLQQVVWNLLSNAVKFSSSSGVVVVRLSRSESSVELVVEDNGQGIEPEFLPHVFERFRQAERGSNRAYGGLGLGLAIVKHIVEIHGGTIRASSEGKGRGATFVIRLPIAPFRGWSELAAGSPASVRAPPAGEHPRSPELEGLRVLVVDDEQDALDLIVAVLEPSGVEVTTAGSACEALAIFEATRPDVLVSDLGMPGEDGYSLIQRVRALPASRGGRTPAVALTAYARMEDRTRAMLAGFTIHMPKPIEPAELLAVLATASGRRTADGRR